MSKEIFGGSVPTEYIQGQKRLENGGDYFFQHGGQYRRGIYLPLIGGFRITHTSTNGKEWYAYMGETEILMVKQIAPAREIGKIPPKVSYEALPETF